MDIYREFIQRLRKFAFGNAYVMVHDDYSPKLKVYVRLLLDVKFQDGSYHAFYGDVKKIVNSFRNFINLTIDKVIKEADRHSQVINKDELLSLMERTLNVHQTNQVDFGREYLPVKSPAEKQIYDEIEEKHHSLMENLYDLKARLEKLDKQEKVHDFAKDHFTISVRKTSEVFDFAHMYISMLLADRLYETRVSLEEILLRTSNNLRQLQEECDDKLNDLLHQLYEKNKESLVLNRREWRCSTDSAEVTRGLEKIRQKINNFDTEVSMTRLNEEVAYWDERLREFNRIASNLTKLKTEQENVSKQEQIYNSMRSTELPGSKYQCWENMGANFKQRREYLKEEIVAAARVLLTFFSVRGTDRIFYTDKYGPYYVDQYNHQVYVFDYGFEVYHVNCDGSFKEVKNNDKYYFDKCGRFINENGEKMYQCASCTSLYKLGDDELLTKVTKDCGHSEKINHNCRMEINDHTDGEMLPSAEPVNIKGTLNSEVVHYLWDTFGSLLPEALHDVGLTPTKNPIHQLAHKLLLHKYKRNFGELIKKNKEARIYKDNVSKERKDRAVAASQAWKEKQVKRRKPEESDDAQERAVYENHIARKDFINSLNSFDN